MSDTNNVLGRDVNLYLDTSLTATPNWEMVACITETNIDQSRTTIDASSKCGLNILAGQKNAGTSNFKGFYITDPTVTQVSMNTIAALYDDGLKHHWKLSTVSGSDYYREFNGYLTTYNESSNFQEAVNFTGAISISGDVILVKPTT
jgi:hypothetical protein